MAYSWRQEKVIINHYLINKDNKSYIKKGDRPGFSITKMSNYSLENLGFFVSRDSISRILEKSGHRKKDASKIFKRKKRKPSKDDLFWNEWLCKRWVTSNR